MTRLPTVGGDSGAWGTVLNQFLQVGHTASGLNSNIVSAFNVKDDAYGAKGDGATDDTAAIQACINAAVAVTIGGTSGAVVFFPYGAYAISSPLIVDGSRITLFGFGNRKSNTSIFIKFGFDPSYALIVGNTANVFDVAIMGIDFVGPNLTTTTGGGLNLRCQGMKLYQVRVVTFGGNGVVVQAFSGTIFEVFFDDVLLVVNGMNAITPLDNLLIASSCTDSEYHRVISLGPATKNMTRNGFFVNGAGTQKFQNCHAYFCSNDGFKSFGADTQIIGGEWENNVNAGIEVGGARALIQGATCFGNTAEDILATGSTSIVGCACTSTATSNIYLNAAAGGSVSDCFLSGAFSAIYLDTSCAGYTIHDNNCSATTAHVLNVAAQNSDIHDNVITGGGGILEVTGAQGNNIHDNTLIGGGTITRLGTAAFYSVASYGALGNGTTDDTAAINRAITAAATGGIVFFPPGTYKTSAALIITADNIILRGAGWNSIIAPASGAQFDVISTPIPGSVGLSGFVRNYIGIEQLMIDCSNMTGTTAGQGNGIHWYGVRYSFIRDVYVKSCKNWAILLDGDNTGPGNNFGYDCQVFRCVFDLCNANVWNTNSEAHDIMECRFKWAGTACAANQPAFATQDTNALHLRCSGGYMSITNNIFGKGGTYTTEAIRLSNSGPCKVIGNRFDQVRNQAVVVNAGNHIVIGNQLGSPGSAVSGVPGIQIGSSKNTITGNKFDITAGAMNATYAIAEAGGPFADNIIADNNLLTGTTGFISQNATSTNKVHHNPGYNPVGSVTTPGFPATTVAATNTTGVDVTAYIANGTAAITLIQIAGAGGTYVTTGQQIALSSWGNIRIPAGGGVKFTYASGTPTWVWMGD